MRTLPAKRHFKATASLGAAASLSMLLLSTAPAVAQPTSGPGARPQKDDEAPPHGYHLEERIRPGLLYTGVAVAFGGYLTGTLEAPNVDKGGWVLVPVIGPWVWLSGDHVRSGARGDVPDSASFAPAVIGLSGALQGVGALLVTLGFSATKTWIVPDRSSETSSHWFVTPTISSQGSALVVSGSL